MTKSLRGSSLPQARSYHHNHYHLHNQRAATPENAHRQLDDTDADPSPTTPSPDAATSSSAAAPRIVVQTVSLIQIVDATGSPIQVQTIFPTTATVDASSTNSAALDLSIAAVPSSTSSTETTSSSSSSSTTNDSVLSTPAPTTPAPTTSSSTDSSTSQDISLTSDPLSTPAPSEAAPSLYPTLSGQSNSTISFLTSTNSSSSSVSTTTSLSSQLSSGTTSVTDSILSSLSSTTWGSNSGSTATSTWASTSTSGSSRLSTSTFTTSASQSPSSDSTASGDGTAGGIGGGGGGAAETAAPTSTSTSDDSSGSGSPTPTGTVVGSVVGSLAGAAFLVVLVFLALRWRKRSGGRFRLSEASAGKRGILTGSGGPPGGNSGGMVQRSLSFDPTTAAAGAGAGAGAMAAAHKPSSRRASEPSETGERGFVRVAGRKLPSVLQSGGDGYTDPRDGTSAAVNDDESVYFRDSQAFFDPNGQTTRLALGSPMRPVSGVVVFKESPARTPVTESAPFPPPAASPQSNPPFVPLQPPGRDPIGRTLPSQDGSRGSRGSASRFHEDM